MNELIFGVFAALFVGIILLLVEYRTGWFVQYLNRDRSRPKHPDFHAYLGKGQDKGTVDVLTVIPIDAESYFWDYKKEPFKGRVITAQFELESSSPKAVYVQELRVGLELGVDLDQENFDLRRLYDLVFDHTLTLWTVLQRGMQEPYPLCAFQSTLRMDPEIKEKTFRAVLDPDASKVKILNAVDQEPIRLDRWIEVSGHTGRYVWDVIVFFGKQWVDILDHQRLRPYNVYLNLRLHNGRTRVVKAPISGTVVVTSEAKERTLQKAIFGNEGEQ